MFSVDPNITDLKVRERNLYKVLFSMNIHQVATPELSAEDAKSYIFFFREGNGKLLAHIGFYFPNSDRKLYYSHSSNPFSEGDMSDVESEARSFAEDTGAMLDEIDIAKMSPEEKSRWIEEQDIFSEKRKVVETAQEPQELKEEAPAVQTAPQEPVAPAPAAQAPVAQPAPVVQSASTVQPTQFTSAPALQPQVLASPTAPAIAAPQAPSVTTQRPQPPTPRPQRKQPVTQPESSQTAPIHRDDDVLEDAVKAGIVKAPKAQLKKDIRISSGVVSRDKEALARLLSSF